MQKVSHQSKNNELSKYESSLTQDLTQSALCVVKLTVWIEM